MLDLRLHFRTAWEDYFPSTTLNNLTSQTYTSRQTPSSTGVYVSKCLFRSISSTGNGGALYCSSVTYLLIESTTFFSCKTSGVEAGAFYITIPQIVLYEVCCYDCYSTYNGAYFQCGRLNANSGTSNKNYFNYSSIVRSAYENSNSYGTLRLACGKICCPSSNISMNKCKIRAFYCDPSSDSNSVTCSLSYSSFADNTATQYTLFFLWTSGAFFEIKNCNIIRNTQGTLGSEGTIYTIGNVVIKDSCILENKANCIFCNGPITLSNCTVDSVSNNGYLTIQNTVTKSFILALNHMSTQNCHSENDAVGTLTAVVQTLSSSKKQIQCFTYGNYFNQPRLTDTFASAFILLFNFIHLSP
jgi:predicted outer membrane repeat protein